MPQILNLNEAGGRLRKLVQALRLSRETCEVKDEAGRTVAVVLPVERYASYQAYLREREQDFSVLDKVAEDLKDFDPDFLEGQIEKAASEVKNKKQQQAI